MFSRLMAALLSWFESRYGDESAPQQRTRGRIEPTFGHRSEPAYSGRREPVVEFRSSRRA